MVVSRMAAGRGDSTVEHEPPACVVKKRLAGGRRAEAPCQGAFGILQHMDSRDRIGALPEVGLHPCARFMKGPIEEHVRVEFVAGVSDDKGELPNTGPGAGTIGMSEHD